MARSTRQDRSDALQAQPSVAAWLAEHKLPCDSSIIEALAAAGVVEVSDLALLVSATCCCFRKFLWQRFRYQRPLHALLFCLIF